MKKALSVSALLGGSMLSMGASNALAQDECVLTIAPGAVIAAESTDDFIVIEQGCKIDARGTAEAPIIMTHTSDVDGTLSDPENATGLWGGLVINGYAPINDCPAGNIDGGSEACTKEGEVGSGVFGGDKPDDNSGVLQYVVVKYAGSNVNNQEQLNGIAFQGVGYNTVVDHIQVHNNQDDGIEFFGGTVSATHVVLTGNRDDSLDWTDGWTGNIQYLYIEQRGAGDNAIEADNRESDFNADPTSSPSISNMTIQGLPGENGVRLRHGTEVRIANSFVDGSATCLRVNDESRNKLGQGIVIEGTSFACATTHRSDDDGAVAAYLDGQSSVSQNGDRVDPVTPMESLGDPNFSFETTDFVGAFGAVNWADGWTVSGSISSAEQPDFGCPEGTATSSRDLDGSRICELSGTITQDITLTSNNFYELVGRVAIGNDNADSATLTIQAGTTIFGRTTEDFLVVSRGSKIMANGSRMAPITFTGIDDLNGNADIDLTDGLWGGLVLNGNAPINACGGGATGGTAQCTKEGEASTGVFGGDQPEDSSGRLNYVVVKYAGAQVDSQNELNGIAFQGVGSGTEVNYVQVHNNSDDGVEFFGGTVNVKYLVLTGNDDDSMDWTDGWTGKAQYVLIDQRENGRGDSGIEADNLEGDFDAAPRSMPSIANLSIFGNSSKRGIRLRHGTAVKLYNTTVERSASCLQVQDEALTQLASNTEFDGVSFNCAALLGNSDAGEQDTINAKLDASNVSKDGRAVPAADLSGDDFFDNVDFIGAIEDENNDWTSGWTVGMPEKTASLGCPVGTTEESAQINSTPVCTLSGTYTSDLTLVRGNIYRLGGKVVIGEDAGQGGASATLTVQSGVTIIGDDSQDFLVVSRGSDILVNGTKMAPVTMTAELDLTGNVDANSRGLWGGLVINGFAPINDCPANVEGGTAQCTKEGEAESGLFGGDQPADSSGRLNYLVVKYAGNGVDSQNQLNGIAFQGVGSGTEVDYIQVHNNFDDGVEFFGGTVDVKHVILTGNNDDSMDWTDGWVGRAQYVHIDQQGAGDNGIEADNRDGGFDNLPRSAPDIANMTIVASSDNRAVRLRHGTAGRIFKAVLGGSSSTDKAALCLRVDDRSQDFVGTDIILDEVAMDCTAIAEGTGVQAYLDGANVTQDGSAPATQATLPADGFFEANSTLGSGVEEWGAGWSFGLGL